MFARMGPVEAAIDEQIASGVDFFWVHVMKAIIQDIRGNSLLALEHLEKATTRSILPIERLQYFYQRMGWDEDPDFDALRERHRNYMIGESSKLLAMACGPDGFVAWQPSEAQCGKTATPAPN